MFNEDILIDRNKLEEECSTAPAYFDYWSTQEADLKTDKENLENNLSKEIRQLSEDEAKIKYGLSKVTEGAITAIIKSDPQLQKLTRQQRYAESARRSYEKKIALLDVLARLHGQGYFSKIEGKPELRTMLAKEAKAKIQEAIRDRREKESKSKPARPKR